MRRAVRFFSIYGLILISFLPVINRAIKSGNMVVIFMFAVIFIGAAELAHLADLAIRYLQLLVYERANGGWIGTEDCSMEYKLRYLIL